MKKRLRKKLYPEKFKVQEKYKLEKSLKRSLLRVQKSFENISEIPYHRNLPDDPGWIGLGREIRIPLVIKPGGNFGSY